MPSHHNSKHLLHFPDQSSLPRGVGIFPPRKVTAHHISAGTTSFTLSWLLSRGPSHSPLCARIREGHYIAHSKSLFDWGGYYWNTLRTNYPVNGSRNFARHSVSFPLKLDRNEIVFDLVHWGYHGSQLGLVPCLLWGADANLWVSDFSSVTVIWKAV